MDNLAVSHSPLDAVLIKGVFGAETGPGVTLSEQRGGALLDLAAGAANEETRRAVAKQFDVALPTQSGGSASNGDHRALWIGPGHWLIKTAAGRAHEQAWADAAPDAAVNDVTHGRVVVRISGPRARDILAKGCPLDLHPTAFPGGACAQSLLGKISVTLDCLNENVFEIIAGRAYAKSLLVWITNAAAEYGFKVE